MIIGKYKLSISFEEDNIEIYLREVKKSYHDEDFCNEDLFIAYKYVNKLNFNMTWSNLKINELCELIRYLYKIKNLTIFC